jgi:hypothetical protein
MSAAAGKWTDLVWIARRSMKVLWKTCASGEIFGGWISVFFGRGLEKRHADWKQGSMYPAMNRIQT